MRSGVAYYSQAWRAKLTEEQRQRWNVAGGKVPTQTRCGQAGVRTGEQHYVGINAARWCIHLSGFAELPEPVSLLPNPVGALSIIASEQGIRLLLTVTGPVTEDIMVFGQAPGSAGRNKRRNVSYLGLMPAPTDGVADITDLYVAKYGPLRPGTKLFIVTRQQKNGWESEDKVTSEIVPGEVEGPQSAVHGPQSEARGDVRLQSGEQQAPAEGALPLKPHMHKGCTRDAQGSAEPPVPDPAAGGSAPTSDGMMNDEAVGELNRLRGLSWGAVRQGDLSETGEVSFV